MKYLFILMLLVCCNIKAELLTYTIKSKDSLDKIVKQKLGEDDLSLADYQMVTYQLKRYNPHIRDWNHLVEGTIILLSSPLDPSVSNFTNAYLHAACSINHNFYQEHPNLKPTTCGKY